MNEEVLRVLKMVEDGKISADKAKEIIDALGNTRVNENNQLVLSKTEEKRYDEKFLKIKVLSAKGDKVNIQLPVKVIKEIMKATGKLPIKAEGLQGVDLEGIFDTVIRCLDNEVMGEIVDISSAEGDIVKIVIE